MKLFFRKIRSAHSRWVAYRAKRVSQVADARRQKLAVRWLREFAESPAEILIGGNFVDLGGCRQHMHSLARFSSLKTELVPAAKVMDGKEVPDFSFVYEDFLNTPASPTVKAAHSHVFPWFIKWCIAQREKLPVWVHTHHAWYFDEYHNGTPVAWHDEFNHYFAEALRRCDVPLCVSRWQQQFLFRQLGLKTHYVPNGVDLSLCLAGSAVAFRQATGLHQPFVLWVGRNDPVKNPAEMLHLAAVCPEFTFCLVGPGLSAETMQADYGMATPPNVIYTGRLTQADVQNAIAASAVLVVTSRREGLPTLVLEGLAQQKPIVVPDEDGCVEALGGPEFGQIYQLGNIDSLKQAMQAAIAGPQHNIRALQRVRDEFDWPVIMRKLDRVYRGGAFD